MNEAMGDELLITASPYGMQAAAVAGGRPVAYFIEWAASPSRIGDVHVARPLGRMTGIDACIVDIGDGEGRSGERRVGEECRCRGWAGH